MSAKLTGEKDLDRKLKRLGTEVAIKAAKAGIRAGMTPVLKAMKTQIAFSDAPLAVKIEAQKTLGKRLIAKKRITAAKVGFAVGTKAAKKKRTTGATGRRMDRFAGASGKRGGVGISDANIHWFVLGVGPQRVQDTTGRQTGGFPGMFVGLAERALVASAKQSIEATAKGMRRVIEREAQKR